jgi:electron-transferring-flavoprotein dehydrogenase
MQHLDRAVANPPEKIKPDGKLTFDKLSDVFHSGTNHEEDQPCHLKIADFDVCNSRCTVEYGNPCQFFCPAAVYEMEANPAGPGSHLKINASNCVHCKTCDIADPYQIITWVPPEGGGGPHYDGL